MEEGEITDPYAYDPCYEWPGDEDIEISPLPKRSRRPICRFVVSRTAVLPAQHRIVSADDYTEIQFGRDAQFGAIPRVRLKEMQVSKLHATAYWDPARKEWNVVDMGSKHGTFLHSPSAPSSSANPQRTRLSGPRSSSRPTRLRHLDSLSIGSTTFLVHIHDNMIPCRECTPSDGDEISLFPSKTSSGTEQGFQGSTDKTVQPAKDSRTVLNDLKRTLLARHAQPAVKSTSEYLDRSAKRRALYTASRSDAPGVFLTPPPPRPLKQESAPPPPPVTITDDTPVPSASFGHRLLLTQGWQPGTSLGMINEADESRLALTEPLRSKSTTKRAGIGMKLGKG